MKEMLNDKNKVAYTPQMKNVGQVMKAEEQ